MLDTISYIEGPMKRKKIFGTAMVTIVTFACQPESQLSSSPQARTKVTTDYLDQRKIICVFSAASTERILMASSKKSEETVLLLRNGAASNPPDIVLQENGRNASAEDQPIRSCDTIEQDVIEALQGETQVETASTICRKLKANLLDTVQHNGVRYDVRIHAYAVKPAGMPLVLSTACDIEPTLRW